MFKEEIWCKGWLRLVAKQILRETKHWKDWQRTSTEDDYK